MNGRIRLLIRIDVGFAMICYEFGMEEESLPSGLTRSECRIRAALYRQLAHSAVDAESEAALVRLAERYDKMVMGSLY